MAASTVKDASLAGQLQKWSVEEMHFLPQGRHINSKPPTLEHFKSICRGPTLDIWKFVLSHVRSAQTVKEVQGNLALKGKQKKSYRVRFKSDTKYDHNKQDLLDKRVHLSGEVTSVLTDINHLENDLKRLQKEVTEIENSYQAVCSTVSDQRHKAMLLHSYSDQCQAMERINTELSKKINTRVNRLLNRAKKSAESEEYYSRKRSSTEDDHYSSGLETKCSRQVRQTCEAVGTFLNSMLQGGFSSEKEVLQRKKELLWSEVEGVMGEFSVPQVYSALLVNTQNSVLALRETTLNIDIRRDAEKLRFKYEKTGSLTDVSSSPSPLQSVHQLIEESQMAHIKQFMDTEKHNNTTWQLTQRLEDVKEQIDSKLHKVFKNKDNIRKAKLLLDTEMNLAGKRMALNTLMSETDHLREKISKSFKDKEVLQAKYMKIQDFKEIVDRKQNLIRVLSRQNGSAYARLQEHQAEIQDYIKRSLLSHHKEVKSLTTRLQGSASQEVEAFAELAMPYLLFSTCADSALKVANLDMSISQTTDPVSIATRLSLHKVLQMLNFPPYQAPEYILTHCLEEKTKMEDYSQTIRNHDNSLSDSRKSMGDPEIVTLITELCVDVTEHDKKQIERSLPSLQKRINAAGTALADCVVVKQAVEEWWDQPAQVAVPWIVVDKHNVQQWRDRWTVIVTQLRQLLVQKQ